MSELPRPTSKAILKAVFWNRWGAVVGTILAIVGFLDFVDGHFAPRFPEGLKNLWTSLYVLPSFTWRSWITIIAVALLIVAIHGAYSFAMGYSKRYEELTKNKVIFEFDEIGTRVFITQDPTKITARLKLRFHNKEPSDEHVRNMRLSLHHLVTGEIGTWIIDDRYFGPNEVEIPRDGFEGMLIQGKRLTPWYFCLISLDLMQGEDTRIPEDLTGAHYLKATMTATNQVPYSTRIFVNWEKACNKNGTAILSYGAPAIRRFENRRLFEKSD